MNFKACVSKLGVNCTSAKLPGQLLPKVHGFCPMEEVHCFPLEITNLKG